VSGYDPEQSHRDRLIDALDAINARLVERTDDAWAQLWIGIYRDQLNRLLGRRRKNEIMREEACAVANAAVADFDEHYLGGKR
jgi:hypothetical protein